MDTLIPLGLLGLMLAGLVIGYPFLAPGARVQPLRTRGELETQLAQILKTVRDLDFDYDMGKVPAADYALQRKALIGTGVSLLIQIDAAEEALEARIAAFRHPAPLSTEEEAP